MQDRALLLDKNYIAISIVTWKKAVKLLIKGKAEIVHNSDSSVSLLKGCFVLPSVIRLLSSVPWKAHIVGIRFTRKNIIIRDDGICQYCGEKVGKNSVTIDHVIPKSRGGTTDFLNCVISCSKCNGIKADRTPVEAGMKLLHKPRQPSFYTLYRNYLHDSPEEWKLYIMGAEDENRV
jgi:5-methylcytosine-specific restriction endonuclease McrA